jgi:hypothetical protein
MDRIFNQIRGQSDFTQLLQEHSLLGYYYQFHDLEKESQYKSHYKRQWIINSLILEELKSISSSLDQNVSPVVILKGGHLIMSLYKDVGSRFMSDLDLYIDSNEYKNWSEQLIKNGFTKRNQKTFYGNNYKSEWTKLVSDFEITIELHTKLFFHHDFESWASIPSPISGFNFLSAEDNLIYLCGHLCFQHNLTKLYWLADVYQLLEKGQDKLNVEHLKSLACELKLFNSAQIVLWTCREHLGLNLTAELEKHFNLNKKNLLFEKLIPLEQLLYPYKNKIRYHLLKHLAKDRLWEAILYDFSWLLHYKLNSKQD